jgi:tyrosyl-tRNA synthetase
MFRYYELLTDVSMSEIAAMQERIARGELHPIKAKLELGRLIVTDFHSPADAAAAIEKFDREVRRKEIPADIPTMDVPEGASGEKGINVDKLIARFGLASSVSDAKRKREAGAVEINGDRVTELMIASPGPEFLIQVGKKWLRFRNVGHLSSTPTLNNEP